MICRKHVGWFDIGQTSFFIKPQLQGQSSFSVTMLPPGGHGALLQWCWWQVRIFCPVSQKNYLQSYLRLSSNLLPTKDTFHRSLSYLYTPIPFTESFLLGNQEENWTCIDAHLGEPGPVLGCARLWVHAQRCLVCGDLASVIWPQWAFIASLLQLVGGWW